MTPSAELAAVFDRLDAGRDTHVARLRDYLRQPSISTRNEGMAEAAALLQRILLGIPGFSVEVVPTAGHSVVLARSEARADLPTLLVYGHYDVQPPEPLDAWTSPPFEPEIRDGRIFARGAGDNKGQHLAHILAIEAWVALHGELPCNVILLIEGEEETGSPNLAAFAASRRDSLAADLVVVSDGHLHETGAPVVCFGNRGFAAFELHARTAGRDAHSGNFGGVVPNAVWQLVHLLAGMKDADGRITIDGFAETLRPPDNAEVAAAAAFPVDLEAVRRNVGFTELDAPRGRDYAARLMLYPTLTINGLHGGHGGAGTKAIIPATAFAKCDIRLVEGQSPDAVLELVGRHVRRHAPSVDFVPLEGTPPARTPLDHPMAGCLQQAVVLAQGVEPLLQPSLGASLPMHVFTTQLGLPTFLLPFANADEANHAPDENIRIDCFLSGIRTAAALLETVARGPAA